MDNFAEVCQMYYVRVYRFLLSLTGSAQQAEELTQETFYKALLHIRQYRDDGHMFTWLCTIGKNAWLDECRKRKRTVPLEERPEGASPSTEDAFVERERRQALRKALLSLPDEYQEVVILHIYGCVPLREIAAQRGKSESWGKVTYYRAKQLLKRRLEEFQ